MRWGPRKGLRAAMYELTDDSHRIAPKKSAKKHPASWYTDGHLAARPEFAFCALANFAEYLLFLSRKSRLHPDAAAAVMGFFDLTRRHLGNVLTNYGGVPRFRGALLETMRESVRRLCAEAGRCYEMARSSTKTLCRCPACNGRRLGAADAELLRQILADATESGLVPVGSKLYTVAT